MLERNIETFLGCDADYADASIVLFGAPFDSTTSFRPGARFGLTLFPYTTLFRSPLSGRRPDRLRGL